MRTILALLLVLMLAIAACGGDDDDDGASGDFETCDDVGAAVIDEIQTLLDDISQMDASAFTSDEQPEELTRFEERLEDLETQSDDIGCSDEDLATYLQDNFDELEADGQFAEIFLQALEEGIQSGEIFQTP